MKLRTRYFIVALSVLLASAFGIAVEQYKNLHVLLHECKWFPCCPMKHFYKQGLLERKWIELYCKGLWQTCIRYQKEENGEYHPDWMLPDGSLDERLSRFSTG